MHHDGLSDSVSPAQMAAAWQELRLQRIGPATEAVLKSGESRGNLSQWLSHLQRHQPSVGEAFTRAAFGLWSTLPLQAQRSAHLLAFPLLTAHMVFETARFAEELRMWLALHLNLAADAVLVDSCFAGYAALLKAQPPQLRVMLEHLLFEGHAGADPAADPLQRHLWPVALVLEDSKADEALARLRMWTPSGLSFSSLRHRLAQLAEEKGIALELYPPLTLLDAALTVQSASLRRWLHANVRADDALSALVGENSMLVLTTGRKTASIDFDPLSEAQIRRVLASACTSRRIELHWLEHADSDKQPGTP